MFGRGLGGPLGQPVDEALGPVPRSQVPGMIGVAGFDDITSLRDVVPGLSTVRLPMVQMGSAAVELAFRGHDDDHPETPIRVRIRGELVLRDSTRRPSP